MKPEIEDSMTCEYVIAIFVLLLLGLFFAG